MSSMMGPDVLPTGYPSGKPGFIAAGPARPSTMPMLLSYAAPLPVLLEYT